MRPQGRISYCQGGSRLCRTGLLQDLHQLVNFLSSFGPWAAQLSPSTWLLWVPLLSPLHKKAAWGSPMDGLLKMGTGDLTPTGESNPDLIWMGDGVQAAPFSGGLTEGHSPQHHRGPQRFATSCARLLTLHVGFPLLSSFAHNWLALPGATSPVSCLDPSLRSPLEAVRSVL